MDNKKTADFVNEMWDSSIIPEISEYIKVPNKSPQFDPDYWLEWSRTRRMTVILRTAHTGEIGRAHV